MCREASQRGFCLPARLGLQCSPSEKPLDEFPFVMGGDDGETRQMSQRLPPARGGTCALDPGQGCVKSTDDGKLPAVIPGSLWLRIWGITGGFQPPRRRPRFIFTCM